MSKEQLMEIGKVINFHGLKGEMKVKPYTEEPERFYELDYVIIDGQEYEIDVARIQKGMVFLNLLGVDTRSEAEKFKDKTLLIPRSEASELEEDEFYIVDLIGTEVLEKETGARVGELIDVIQTSGVVDNFAIKTAEKTIYVPALKEYFEMDPEAGKLLAEIPKEFFEL